MVTAKKSPLPPVFSSNVPSFVTGRDKPAPLSRHFCGYFLFSDKKIEKDFSPSVF